jgi:hypothetical protein
MVHRATVLLRLAPLALLVAAGSCSHAPTAPPRPKLAQREATCAPVWTAAHADIDAHGSACAADWECRELDTGYLGCDAWANRDFKLSAGRLLELEGACAPLSLVPDCGERVGACVAGRCTGRRRMVDAAVCSQSKSELDAKLADGTPCSEESDCAAVMVRGLRGPGPTDWANRYAPTIAAIKEACTPDQDGKLPAALPVAACVAGQCRLRPGDEVARPLTVPATKPQFVDKGCVGNSLRIPRYLAGAIGSVTVTFAVSPRGVPHSFQAEGTRRADLILSLAEAISQCALVPGTSGGLPMEMTLSLPLRFAAAP